LCFISLFYLHIGYNRYFQCRTRYFVFSPVSYLTLYSSTSAQSFTRSAFLNSRICKSSKYSTFAIFFSRQGLIFPLFVLSISTLDISSELMLLLLHIMNTETPYVNLFLCGNLNNNIGYCSVQGFLKVHYPYNSNHTNTLNAM